MHQIHVCHVISDSNVGGAGILLCNLLSCLDESVLSTVILPCNSALIPRIEKTGARIIQAPISPDRSLSARGLFFLLRTLKALRPDTVHTSGALTARLCARALGIPAINTRHCDTKMRYPFYSATADFTVATSLGVLEGLSCVPPTRKQFIPNGSLPVQKTTENERLFVRRSLEIPDKARVVGFVGRLERIKGADVFLYAAKLLREKINDVYFVIVGEGGEKANLCTLCQRLGIEKSVRFVGYTENVGRYMNIFDAGVNSSLGSETCSLAISEMLSLAVPVVASDIDGNKYMLKGGAGLLFPSTDARALADALHSLFCDAALRKRLSCAGYVSYKAIFCADAMARSYEKLYKRIIFDRNL